MPARHRYKCLNMECPGPPRKACTGLFIAMNAPTPECPACGSTKLEDWGGDPGREGWCMARNAAPGASSDLKHDDRTLRRIADRHGLTNMSNAGGKPVRQAATPADGPKINYNGIDVPMVGEKGACVNVPSMARPLEGTWKGAGTPSKMLKGMTNVVAEHNR